MFGLRSPKRAQDHPSAEYTTIRTLIKRDPHPIMRIIVYGLVIFFVALAAWGIVMRYVYNAPPDHVGVDLPLQQESQK